MRKFWNDKTVEEAIKTLVDCTGQKHFPTHSEIINFYNNNALCVQISRRGGSREWAKKMNMTLKDCESKLGNEYELKAIEDIKNNTGFDSYLTKPRYPYDIYTNNQLKIDVKVSMPMKGRKYGSWTFNLEKREPTCDIFIFYCLDYAGSIVKTSIIPACAISGTKQLGMGELSKYDNYADRWDLIVEYDELLNKIKSKINLIPKRRSTDGTKIL